MSVIHSVKCDTDGCTSRFPLEILNMREQRKIMKSGGWKRDGAHKDICPKCVAREWEEFTGRYEASVSGAKGGDDGDDVSTGHL